MDCKSENLARSRSEVDRVVRLISKTGRKEMLSPVFSNVHETPFSRLERRVISFVSVGDSSIQCCPMWLKHCYGVKAGSTGNGVLEYSPSLLREESDV